MSKKLNLLIRVINKTDHAVAVARSVVKAEGETAIAIDKHKDLKSLLAAVAQGKLELVSHNPETLRVITGVPVVEEVVVEDEGAGDEGGTDDLGDVKGGEGEQGDKEKGGNEEGDASIAVEGAVVEPVAEEVVVDVVEPQEEVVEEPVVEEVVVDVQEEAQVEVADKKKRKSPASKKEEK